jgi:signal peptidase II
MHRKSLYRVLVLASLVLAVDQLTKLLALEFLQPGQSVPFIGDFLRLCLVRNDSAAFSIGNGQTWIFTLFSTIAALALLWYGPRTKSTSWALIGGLLLGGVVGNLVDRVTREPGFPNGHVIDFLQLPLGFPIFNLADTSIVIAMSIVVIRILRGHRVGE